MTTKAVKEALEDKSPVVRGSEVYDNTFEIKAMRENDGFSAEITDILFKKQFCGMHYSQEPSTLDSKPLKHYSAFRTREDALRSVEDRDRKMTLAAPVPTSKIALGFKTSKGEKYHLKASIDSLLWPEKEDDLFYSLLFDYRISNKETIQAYYEPTSDSSGKLTVDTSDGTLCSSRQVYEGEPDGGFIADENILEWHRSWLSYNSQESDEDGWVECSVVNAYEDEIGDELALVVRTPIGEKTVFEFDIDVDESAVYWELVNELASGDPANLPDSTNTVYLRHRTYSFHELGICQNRDSILYRRHDVISVDVNQEWELRVTNPVPTNPEDNPVPTNSEENTTNHSVWSRIRNAVKRIF